MFRNAVAPARSVVNSLASRGQCRSVRALKLRGNVRHSSSNASGGGGGGGKLAFATVAATAVAAGGAVGYAAVDAEFRAYLEDNVPGAKDVLETVLGGAEAASPPKEVALPSKLKTTPSSLPVTSKPPSLPPKPVEPPVATSSKPVEPPPVATSSKLVEPATPPPPPITAPPPPPPLEEPVKSDPPKEEVPAMQVAEDPPKKADPPAAAAEKKQAKKKKKTDKGGAASALAKATEESAAAVAAAVAAGQACVNAIGKHGQLVVNVLESAPESGNDQAAWHEVIEAATAKSEAVKAAQEKVTDAVMKLDSLEVLVEKSDASVRDSATDTVKAQRSKLCEVNDEIQSAKKESYLVEQYRDLVEDGRQQFRKEAAALLPGRQHSDRSHHEPLTQEEMNVFITHAYKKVASLQQQLGKLKLLHQQLDQTQVNDRELRKQVVTEEVVQAEIDALRRQLEVEHQQRVAAIREEMEAEMRGQLRRQAAAHTDHIKDALEVQEMEISRKFGRKIDEALAEEKANYKAELAKLSGAVDGLKTAVKDREAVQETVRGAQELWLACSSLQRALEAERPSSGLLPLKDEVDAIKSAIKSVRSDPFVDAVVDSLPTEALHRGVYTDQTLRDRFFRVEAMARRTALVGEEGGSLLLYLLSYLQSALVVTPSTETMPDPGAAVDLSTLDTFDIVWLSRGCVERGDLEQAVKYMTLLRGEPKNMAKEWVREARLLLEARQVCDALMAHASAYGLEAFPTK